MKPYREMEYILEKVNTFMNLYIRNCDKLYDQFINWIYSRYWE